MTGFVSLVGAGPGDPALLTRKAAARLRAADLVLYDALIDPRVLHLARRARRFFVGKRAGRHAMTQDSINGLLIRSARRGRHVVRLKGGDPFVFGRGGEEALALKAAGVAYEVVPGVSSAIAAPAMAGIPVTHRGMTGAFLVISGHDRLEFITATAGIRPNALTVVVLMAVAQRGSVAESLIANGWRRDTPAAIVFAASTSAEHVWRGPLEHLGRVVCDSTSPGTIVVGDVAALDLRCAATLLAASEFQSCGSRRTRSKAQPHHAGAQHVSCR